MNKFLSMLLSLVLLIVFSINQPTTVSAQGDQYLITSDFASYAKNGKIKNFPLSLGMKKADVVKLWGMPSAETMHYTDYSPVVIGKNQKCSKCKIRTLLHYNYQDILDSMYIPIKPVSVSALVKELGQPHSKYESEQGSTTYYYSFGNYEAGFSYEEETEMFDSLSLHISLEHYNSKFLIKTFIDGKKLLYSDHPAVLVQGKLYVPATDVIEGLGGSVYWGSNGAVGLFLNGKDVSFINYSNVVKVNDKLVTLKSKPVTVKQRLLLPFDDYAKLLGIKYNWNPKTNTLTITSK